MSHRDRIPIASEDGIAIKTRNFAFASEKKITMNLDCNQ
jgi:hypothetical protein